MHIADYPENASNCAEFAKMFNIPRLERQCLEFIGAYGKPTANGTVTTAGSDDSGGCLDTVSF